MDELMISGKRFISAKQAARQYGYHADYIGQLIRGGKIMGQKVGRSWYVLAASLEEHFGKEKELQQGSESELEVVISQPKLEKSDSDISTSRTLKEPKVNDSHEPKKEATMQAMPVATLKESKIIPTTRQSDTMQVSDPLVQFEVQPRMLKYIDDVEQELPILNKKAPENQKSLAPKEETSDEAPSIKKPEKADLLEDVPPEEIPIPLRITTNNSYQVNEHKNVVIHDFPRFTQGEIQPRGSSQKRRILRILAIILIGVGALAGGFYISLYPLTPSAGELTAHLP